MQTSTYLKLLASCLLLAVPFHGLLAQGCTNTTQYPGGTIVPNATGAVTTISTCSFQQEYSSVGPAVAGASYIFTCTGGSYITVHEGSSSGTVIATGYSSVTATALASDILYPTWNVDSLCGQASSCQTTTVQFLLDCTPPTATVTTVDSCDINAFFLNVNISSYGDGTSADIVYIADGGTPDTLFDAPIGVSTIGPFTVGQLVDVTVTHSDDPLCNIHFNGQQAGLCPTVIVCGDPALDLTYCYTNNDNHTWHWQSSTGGPIILIFSAGEIESASFDHLRIYDGPDNTSTPVFDHTITTQELLEGVQVIGASGDIYMENSSDGSVSCASGGEDEWVWQVGCLDCVPPAATFTVNTDCDAQNFTIDVDVSALGSDSTLDITNDFDSTMVTTATDTGVWTVGPFPITTEVTLTLVNDSNSLCNLVSDVLTNPLCPTFVTCGEPALEESYCYSNSDFHAWHWQNTNSTGTLALYFTSGTINFPGTFGDNIIIHDGPDVNGPILFQNNTAMDLADTLIQSTGPDIYMELNSLNSTFSSCADGNQSLWNWLVGCHDCTEPVATYEVVTDCDAQTFTVDVHLTDLGSQSTLELINDVDSTIVAVSDTGVYAVGPFPITTLVTVTVQNDTNSLCNIHSAVLTNPLCPTFVTCGEPALEESYCYSNSDFHAWHWQNTNSAGNVALYFTSGTINFPGTFGDNIIIHDGPDVSGPILFQNNTAMDLADTLIQSTGPDIYMELNSLNSTFSSCDDGNQTLWNWLVGCHDCTEPVATYQVVTDCDAQTFTVDVHLTDLGSQSTLELTNDVDSTIVTASDTGVYVVGPFPITTLVTVTVQNDTNSLCNVHSAVLTNPLCPTFIDCGGAPLDLTYCYTNNDNHTWHWQSSTGGPIILIFSAGEIESASFDHLRIYDGPDNTSTPVFDHTITTQELLEGVQVIGTNGDIYMENSSDGSVSCASGSEDEWVWQVGCLDCVPPAATFSVNTDCDAQNFTIDVDVSLLGSDSTLDITNDFDSTMVTTATDTGVWTVGPFPITTEVTLTLVNDSNSLCNLVSDMLTNPLCPTFVTCGEPALEESYCYSNSDFHAWHWQNTNSTGTLALYFSSGTINFPGTFGDNIIIHDGPDVNGPILFQNNTAMDLADTLIQSTGPDIYMELNSLNSTFSSCADGNQSLWNWIVGCHDCTEPVATYTVVTDCDSMQYSVVVDIDSMGTDPVIDITNDNGMPPVPASAVGSYTVGPFPAGSSTTVTLVNDMNSLCNVHSTVLTNPLCPTVLECGADPVTETYCYTNNDNHTWHWQCACGSPLSLEFSAGQIESASFDHLRIYDGPDNNSPILFDHTMTTQEDLTGMLLISSGSDIYMENSSDGSVSCASGSEAEWTWTVGCLDCTNPAALFSVVPDCQHATYQVAVNVTSTGSSGTVRIANTATPGDTLTGIPSGTTLVGPIPMDSVSQLTVLNADNSLCRVFSDAQNAAFADCVIPITEAQNFTYCYTNTDTSYFAYKCADDMPIAITFHAGQLLVNDYVQIYDSAGVSENVLVFQGNLNGDMSGYSINSTNPQHALVMRVVSDSTYSCISGDATTSLNWTVECGYAGIEEESAGNFTMYPNPATSELYMRLPGDTHGSTELRILDVSGRVAYSRTFTAAGAELNTFDLHGLQSGNYSVVVTTPNWVKAQNLQIIR